TVSLTGSDGFRIYIDTFRVLEGQKAADAVLFTHPHRDHYSPRALASVQSEKTLVVGPTDMNAVVSETMEPGQTRDFGRFKLRALPAYNKRGFPHPRAKHWLGYVVEIDGLSVYHAGDTDVVPELADFGGKAPDVALLPAVGFVSLSTQEAVEAARRLGCA